MIDEQKKILIAYNVAMSQNTKSANVQELKGVKFTVDAKTVTNDSKLEYEPFRQGQ